MANVVIAPVGSNIELLFDGIRAYHTEKVVLVATKDNLDRAKHIAKDLSRIKIPAQVEHIEGNILEEMFRIVKAVKEAEGEERVIVNIATADGLSASAALSAAFVNGLTAITMENGQIIL